MVRARIAIVILVVVVPVGLIHEWTPPQTTTAFQKAIHAAALKLYHFLLHDILRYSYHTLLNLPFAAYAAQVKLTFLKMLRVASNAGTALLNALTNVPFAAYAAKASSVCLEIFKAAKNASSAALNALAKHLASVDTTLQEILRAGNHAFSMFMSVVSAAEKIIATLINPMVARAAVILLYATTLMVLCDILRAALRTLHILWNLNRLLLGRPFRWLGV